MISSWVGSFGKVVCIAKVMNFHFKTKVECLDKSNEQNMTCLRIRKSWNDAIFIADQSLNKISLYDFSVDYESPKGSV